MAQDKPYPTIKVSTNIRYREDHNVYTFQMKHPVRWWRYLLLLLPLLLLIKCNKDIAVTCLDAESREPIGGLEVSMSYDAHFLWHDGRFFCTKTIERTQTVDDNGNTVFTDLPCSVFSYVFYCFEKVTFSASCPCYEDTSERFLFQLRRQVNMMMKPRREDIFIKLLDKETLDVLPDAAVICKYTDNGCEKVDSARTDAAGIATFRQMRYCSVIEEIQGSCYGYADTVKLDVPCRSLVAAGDDSALRLRPLKEKFTFFVKNKETRQPIPDAVCLVTITHPGASKHTDSRQIRTSIDGKGIAVYNDAFILSTIAVKASKVHYKDGELDGGPWSVEQFIKQSDSIRTVWLEPEPYLVEFINRDSINGRPIPGVKNVIKIIDPSGKEETVTEISNSNGIFPVTAKEGSRIEIISTKNPAYKQKSVIIEKFKDSEIILMEPNLVNVKLQTVKDIKGQPLLPQCRLGITGSVSGTLPPTDSGSTGEFIVTARYDENISVVASKAGYKTNSTTVRNEPVTNLRNGRKIPLFKPIVYEHSSPAQGQSKNCYEMGEVPCNFMFEWRLCDACTMITVTDGNGNVIRQFGRNAPNGDGNGPQYSPPQGSMLLRLSTPTVCVTKVNVNGHDCWYKITKM